MHIPLKSLKFLALDCQTTGNSLKSSHLLEIGWIEWDTGDSPSDNNPTATTFVIRQPKYASLSKRIQKLTGIGDIHMGNAVEASAALDALLECAAGVARSNRASCCPIVIHYARFEIGFLSTLYEQVHRPLPMPFNVICTHQLASRLMPHLPRKGIRAVAGYLGHSVPVTKRCAHHLMATVHIWRHLVGLLADQADVHTLDQLQRWLKHTPIPVTAKTYPMPRTKRLGLPDTAGIYRMQRSNGDVLYIGKAASLKKRINSYFHKRRHPEATLEMLTQAVDLEIAETGSALEAALAESDAIKECDPPYNSALVRRHRKILFTSRDFSAQSSEMNETCTQGPVTSAEPFVSAHALGLWLSTKRMASLDISHMMAIPDDVGPDEAMFLSGVKLFQEKHRAIFNRMDIARAFLHIGRLSWMDKLAHKAAKDTIRNESAPAEETIEFQWTPETVAGSIESICRRCGFLLRRARWFAILSESTVAWRTGPEALGDLNVVMMHKGDLQRHYRTEDGSQIPIPMGLAEGNFERRSRIDLIRYDRLRVLTTELRRIISENRLVCVRLGKKACLRPVQLQKLLNWV